MLISKLCAKLGFDSVLKSKFYLFLLRDLFSVNRDQNNIRSLEHYVHFIAEWSLPLWLWASIFDFTDYKICNYKTCKVK